ncbi:MAG: DUF5657 family protein [Patescibacteria group bacterium]
MGTQINPDLIAQIVAGFSFLAFFKLFSLVLIFFYFIFTLVVYRQVTLMNQILETSFTPLVKLTALVQIVAVVVLFFLVFLLV